MLGVGLRGDAMAEIEDQWSVAECLEDGVDPFIEGRAAGDNPHRIEIALHRPVLLQLGREGQRNRPVEADGIGPRVLPIGFELQARTLGEGDDLRLRAACPRWG